MCRHQLSSGEGIHPVCGSAQSDHLSGKPGNVREFDSCQGSVREKILSGKSVLKLFIVSCILVSILDFAELVHFGFGQCIVEFILPPLTVTLVLA